MNGVAAPTLQSGFHTTRLSTVWSRGKSLKEHHHPKHETCQNAMSVAVEEQPTSTKQDYMPFIKAE
jgi:hypothetical protein